MKYAFKIAYFGENFFGSQCQPELRTVEGEIKKALKSLGIESKPKFAGRTDAGVSALGQVFAFESEERITPRILNSALPSDITAWAHCEVPVTFNPRKAKSRIYSYIFLNEGYSVEKIAKAVELLIGIHDFSNFTKGGKSGKREIFRAEVHENGEFLVFEIEGNAFTWNMVRCIATALKLVEKKGVEWFEKMLTPEKHRERVPPSPPYGLFLKDVIYEGVKFEVDDVGKRLLEMRLKKRLTYHGTIYKLISLKLKTLYT
ncbi:MAG: tRNA pseudouridine(38-40) synthase TruA [Archaeoglobaceae archaeon]